MGNILLEQSPQLTAIVACNDLMALGVMAAVQERGARVGEDIAVGGFDDIPAAKHAVPSLTTIRQPIYQSGENLAEMLIQLVNHESPVQTGVLLAPDLVIRESSGQPPL